ncbi:MAG: EAL domain-containing protein [Selenomonadaceae bacterium]
MEHLTDTAKGMADEFVKAFYTQGNIGEIMDTTASNVVAFGTKSTRYAMGREAVERCLKDEHARIAPCKLFRSRLREHDNDDGTTSMVGIAIIRSGHHSSLYLHHLTLVYAHDDGKYVLQGIHIMRHLYHEGTYRMICSKMLAGRVEADSSRTGRHDMDVVMTYAQSSFVVYTVNRNRHMETFTDELWKMLEYTSKDEFIYVTHGEMRAFMRKDEIGDVQSSITAQLLSKDVYQVEYPVITRAGTSMWVMECGRRLMDSEGHAVYYATLMDITPLKQASEQLTYQVSYDDLTGLFNKTAFCQMAQEILVTYPDESFELMAMDIERFKIINDLFGEEMGDKILRYLADFFKVTKLSKSVFTRAHSDRFIMFYPTGDGDYIRKRFIKSLKVLAASFTLGYRIVLHFGIFPVTDHHMSVTMMCDRAMLALMKAKRDGVHDFCVYDDTMRHHIVAEQAIVNEMSEALTRGDFLLYLQPKYDAITERIVGAEALVRWKHPTKGMISPAEFIPVFEHNGFIFQLDQFVWEETCRVIRRWLDEGKDPAPISINVSRVDFYSTQLVSILETLIKKYRIPHELIDLEITESAYTDNPQQIISATKQLQECGFKILMDDFGSGYSSLNMLKNLPVDVLKIDLKFLSGDDENDRGGNILNSVVRMAKWMRMPVVVEGVETRQQVDFLRTIGCNYIQGYYFSKPVPIEEYEKLMDRQGKQYGQIDTIDAKWPDDNDIDELLDSNTNFNLLFNGMLGGIGLYEYENGGLELLRANDAFFKLMEAPANDVMDAGKDVMPYIDEEDRELLIETIERARSMKMMAQCVLRRTLLNKKRRWFKVKANVILDDNGRLLLFLAWEDATETYELPIELQNMIDGFQAGLVIAKVKNDVLRVVYMNRWLWKIDGLPLDDYSRQNPIDYIDLVGEETAAMFIREIKNAAELNGRPYKIEYPFKSVTGESMWLRATFSVETRPDKSLMCYATVYDITREHQEHEVGSSNVEAARTTINVKSRSFDDDVKDLARLRKNVEEKSIALERV